MSKVADMARKRKRSETRRSKPKSRVNSSKPSYSGAEMDAFEQDLEKMMKEFTEAPAEMNDDELNALMQEIEDPPVEMSNDELEALLQEVIEEPQPANDGSNPTHTEDRDSSASLVETLHGAINDYTLPPRVVHNDQTSGSSTDAMDIAQIQPAPIAMSKLLPQEDEHEILTSRLVHEGGRSMDKTSNRIARGMEERTTRAHDASPAQIARNMQQWTDEDRFGDHRSAELFNAAHTVRGVHSMAQPAVRELVDPIAPLLGPLVHERNLKAQQGAPPALGNITQRSMDQEHDMLVLDAEIDRLLQEIDSQAQCESSGGPSLESSVESIIHGQEPTDASNTSSFAQDAPAYARSYYTNDETMEELNRALRQIASNVQANMQMDPLRERHTTMSGVFQPATNNYLERLLMEAPQPTPGQRSWEITKGVMLRHGICLSRAVFDMYLCAPTRGQRACSAGTQCLVMRLYGVQSMMPLREFDALNLMEQMGEPECTPAALGRCYEKRREDAAQGTRRYAQPTHQLCVLCIMYNIAKAHMQVLNSNTSLPYKASGVGSDSSTSTSSDAAVGEPELTLARLYVRIGPGEFSKQECLFPSVTQYTGLLGPVPIITLFSFQDYERRESGQILRALRYLGHEPRQESNVGF